MNLTLKRARKSVFNEDVAALSLKQLSDMIRNRKISCSELTQGYLDRIKQYDGQNGINAYITVNEEKAVEDAKRLDNLLKQNKYLGPLHGIPIALKDNIDTKGIRTTGGSKILQNWVPPEDANVVSRLKSAGAIIIGKNNMHEFARGITSNNPHYGPVRNPYDKTRIPGGSSGGSAAAVAAGLCAGAIGTDTGGSVRIPAALCGVVGFRPTLGRVGRGGVIWLSFTLDAVGPITRTVEDSAILLKVIAGPDPRDPDASSGKVPDYSAFLKTGLRGVKLGIPRKFFYEDNDPEVDRSIEEVLKTLEKLGAVLVDVDIKNAQLADDTLFKISGAEAVYLVEVYLKQFDQSATIDKYLDQFGPDVRARFASQKGSPQSKPIPAYSYIEGLRKDRAQVIESFQEALKGVGALVTPTTPLTAAKIGDDVETELSGRKVNTFGAFGRYTFSISLVGMPAISVPAGWTSGGLPLGVQFVGRNWDEPRIIQIAYAYQEATKWRRPPNCR